MTASPMSFDVAQIPFSTSGSWLDVSPVVGLHSRAEHLHLVSHRNGMHGVLTLVPERGGAEVAVTWSASPSELGWHAADGARVRACFHGERAMRLRGEGLDLRLSDASQGLTPFSGTFLFVDPVDGAAIFTSYETGRRYRVTMLDGRMELVGSEALGAGDRSVVLGAAGAAWEAVVEETTSAAPAYVPHGSFDDTVARQRAAFDTFVEAIAPWRDETTSAAERAAYVLWSATVSPEGYVRRPAVLMSKHWMDKLWSWDHCFNALALAQGEAELALDQFLAPFDHQDESGALPDSITHSEVLYNYVKPPIHGWALRRLRATLGRAMTTDELETVYDSLARWSTFWLESRRRPGHALPYYQHGNDSGWDNATTFDVDRVVESPDLAGFLALQLEVLHELALELGHPAPHWKSAADELLDALVRELWDGTSLVALGALSGRPSTATSLLRLLPLVVGDRLPTSMTDALVDQLDVHLTPHGPATEPVTSEHYEDDGYWRGPIWAPSTALIEDGLRTSGRADLADVVRDSFLRLCESSGFAENFDARTGEGLRDRAYTWTASVYLLFARAATAPGSRR